MKKHTLLIIVGGISLILGIIFFNNKKQEPIYYYESNITVEEATSLVYEKTKSIVDIYENPTSTFKIKKNEETEEPLEYLEVSNYDEVIDNLYTIDGKKELEGIKFNNNLFIKKIEKTTEKSDSIEESAEKESEEKEDVKVEYNVFVLASIPESNSFAKRTISIEDVSVNGNTVKAKVIFSSDELDENDVLTYYVFEKNIELIKKDNKWLVNSFVYSNK